MAEYVLLGRIEVAILFDRLHGVDAVVDHEHNEFAAFAESQKQVRSGISGRPLVEPSLALPWYSAAYHSTAGPVGVSTQFPSGFGLHCPMGAYRPASYFWIRNVRKTSSGQLDAVVYLTHGTFKDSIDRWMYIERFGGGHRTTVS